MKNQKVKNAIVEDESASNPHQGMERVVLYNKDGTPYNPSFEFTLIVASVLISSGFKKVSESHAEHDGKIIDFQTLDLYQGNGTDSPTLIANLMSYFDKPGMIFVEKTYDTMEDYEEGPSSGGVILVTDSDGTSTVISGLAYTG